MMSIKIALILFDPSFFITPNLKILYFFITKTVLIYLNKNV